MLCDLQIFSGKVYHPEPPHAQSLFLFPIVFGTNKIIARGKKLADFFVRGQGKKIFEMNSRMLWKKDRGLVNTSTLGLSFDLFCKIGRRCDS